MVQNVIPTELAEPSESHLSTVTSALGAQNTATPQKRPSSDK